MNVRLRLSRMASRIRRTELAQRCMLPTTRSQRDVYELAEREGLLVQPLRGLFARAECWEALSVADQVLHCMRSLQMLHPEWVFMGASAALVHGLAVHEDWMLPMRVAAQKGSRTSEDAQASMLIRQDLDVEDAEVIDHLRVTPLLRSAFDCMREMDFAKGLAIADSALALSGLSRDEFIQELDGLRNTSKGGRYAMITASFADGHARSLEESLVRATVIELGFAAPQANVDGHGSLGWRLEDGSLMSVALQDLPESRDDLTQFLGALGVPLASGGSPIGVEKPYRPQVLQQAN